MSSVRVYVYEEAGELPVVYGSLTALVDAVGLDYGVVWRRLRRGLVYETYGVRVVRCELKRSKRGVKK